MFLSSVAGFAQATDDAKPLPTIADKTKQFKKLDGFFPIYWDEHKGRVWLEVSRWNTEFLFLDSLPAGIGSNDIGLDRGQLGEGRVVEFERVGPRVLLKQLNLSFRASSDNPAERRSVQDAFAQSVLWGFEVAAEENDRVLVDATAFFMSDAHHVADTLKRTKQGTFKFEASRSAIYLDNTRNFPQNTEVEATLTFTLTSDEAGKWVQDVTPDPSAITVREHYSFIQLPDNNYQPRAYDPRSGFIPLSYADYSAPVGQSLEQRFILRHRLEKKDPTAAVSDPVKPIVYYLDPGTPEPIRSALLEGASWWKQAFEAAGFRNAFRVEMLPAGADPMDVRYNDIQWVHRATRGWSYGAAIVDPRTGEIIKGHVTLGSLRARQDYLIFEGLLAPYKQGQPTDPRLMQMVLARMRQLAAHEVGHTLGLMHNYVASTENRSSVMDYPAPMISLAPDGSFNTADAYATGIGEWDKVSIQWGYSQFSPKTDQKAALDQIIDNARARGLTFLTDQDARPSGSASPVAHLWDNGKNAVDELNVVMKVRAQALATFRRRQHSARHSHGHAGRHACACVPLPSLPGRSRDQSHRRPAIQLCAARRWSSPDCTHRARGAAARAGCRASNNFARRPRHTRSHPEADSPAPCWVPSHPRIVRHPHWHDFRSDRRRANRSGNHFDDIARPRTRGSALAGPRR